MEYDNIAMIGDMENVRYMLKKEGTHILYVIGLNPSTADNEKPDPTIRKVMGFAEINGFDGFAMFNIYPQRSTNPDGLHRECDDGLHSKNLSIIQAEFCNIRQPVILLAYGNAIETRNYLKTCLRDITDLLQPLHPQWKQIGALTRLGHPRHPLYARYELLNNYTMIPWEIIQEMKNQGCNQVSFLGLSDGMEVYSIGEVDKDGIPVPTGLPVLLLWDGKHIEEKNGNQALELLGTLV